MGDPTVAAYAAQDMKRLGVVVFPVAGVLFQDSNSLAGRTRGAGKQYDELATDSLEVVDVPLDVEYDDNRVVESGTNS